MGWVVHDYRGRLLLAHAGLIDGFRAQITLVPRERLGIVVLANLDQTRMNMALTNSLLDLLLGLPRKNWNQLLGEVVKKDEADAAARRRELLARRQLDTRPSREPAAYAGIYEHPAYGEVRLALERGLLVLRWSSFTAPLAHFHHDTFLAEGDLPGNPQVVFTLNTDGDVTSMDVLAPLNVVFKKRGSTKDTKRHE
jgi:hypothetical protein